MSQKQSSWWDYTAKKTKPSLSKKPKRLPTVDEILSDTSRHLPPSVVKDTVTYDPAFMETTRTFTRRIREYWNI